MNVTLQEFSIGTDPTTVDAGEVVVEATNDGPNDVHEFVVFRTDLGPTELPTDENGAVDETGEGIELIGEIEDIPVEETETCPWTGGRRLRLRLQHLGRGRAGIPLPRGDAFDLHCDLRPAPKFASPLLAMQKRASCSSARPSTRGT